MSIRVSTFGIEYIVKQEKYVGSATTTLTGHHPTLVASGVTVKPTFTGSAVLSKTKSLSIARGTFKTNHIGRATLSKTRTLVVQGIRLAPVYLENQVSFSKQASLKLSGTLTNPVYTGQSKLTAQHPTIRALFTPPIGVLNIVRHPVLVIQGIVPKIYYTGSASLATKKASLKQGSSTYSVPVYTGRAILSKTKSSRFSARYFTGTPVENSATLFISGYSSISDSLSLYTAGPFLQSSGMNLFISGRPPDKVSDDISLYMYGSSLPELNAKAANVLPLYIPPPKGPSKSLNLFISGVEFTSWQPLSNRLNLFLKSSPPEVAGVIPLLIFNNQTTISDVLPMYIRGLGMNPGYKPAYDTLNLFVSGVGSGSLASPISRTNSIPLIITGELKPITKILNSITMFLKTPDGFPANNTLTLYVNGAVPPVASGSVTLVIPKTSMSNIIPLYVHGF